MNVENAPPAATHLAFAQVTLSADDLYELLAHLVTSAETCSTDPSYYGTFRLIDAAARLSARALERGFTDPWLEHFHEELEVKKGLLFSDESAYRNFLSEAAVRVAEHLRARYSESLGTGSGTSPADVEHL